MRWRPEFRQSLKKSDSRKRKLGKRENKTAPGEGKGEALSKGKRFIAGTVWILLSKPEKGSKVLLKEGTIGGKVAQSGSMLRVIRHCLNQRGGAERLKKKSPL